MLYHRQKLLLGLLEACGGQVNPTDFQKLLFLFIRGRTAHGEPPYDFVPYRFGCFSFQSYADKRTLAERGWLTESDDWQLTPETKVAPLLDSPTREEIARFVRDWRGKRGGTLIAEVYRRHPWYATRSEIADRVLTAGELRSVRAAASPRKDRMLYTIGYEGRSIDAYLDILLRADVRLLCDVRRNPLSRKYGFAKTTLRRLLEGVGIAYTHLPELGIATEHRRELTSQADYDLLFADYERTTLPRETDTLWAIRRLVEKHQRIALTCFEAQPCQCRRTRTAAAVAALPGESLAAGHL